MSEIEHYIGVNLTTGHDESQVDLVMSSLVNMLRAVPGVAYAVAMAAGPEVDTPEPAREDLATMTAEQKELFQDLEAYYAFETGSVDSGKHDPAGRAKRVAELKALDPLENEKGRRALSEWVAQNYLSAEAAGQGYGWEDAYEFLRWIKEEL